MPRSNFEPKAIRLRKHLRAMRERAGLTQTALASRINRTQQWVYKVESGERRLDVIEFIELAEAIGFDASQFLNAFREETERLGASATCRTGDTLPPVKPSS